MSLESKNEGQDQEQLEKKDLPAISETSHAYRFLAAEVLGTPLIMASIP